MKTLAFSIGQKDLKWEFFRCGGKGGQKQNKTDSGARVTHIPSGLCAESREERQQIANRRIALKRLSQDPKFVVWCKMHIAANAEGFVSVAEKVTESMRESNLRVETAPDCVPDESYCDVIG